MTLSSLTLPRKGCTALRDAYNTVERATELGGPVLGLEFAATCYRIPVQYNFDCSVEDLFLMLQKVKRPSLSPPIPSPYFSTRGVSPRGVAVDQSNGSFGHLTRLYHDLLATQCRLPRSTELEPSFRNTSLGTWWENIESPSQLFPAKKSTKLIKVNLHFQLVWIDTATNFSDLAYVFGTNSALLAGMNNDEAVGWVIWACACYPTLGAAVFSIIHLYARSTDALKTINTYTKALGLNARDWGACLCELTTLAGRGVGLLTPIDDVRTRIDRRAFMKTKAAACDPQRLRTCIREVLRRELATVPTWGDRGEYWTRRWLYTKAGSHARYAEQHIFNARLDLPPQATRREFSEAVTENMVAYGTPRVDAGFSEKEEHGKTRAIYGCDTRSYYSFDYLLRPVEAAWRNRRVLLDPGRVMQTTRYTQLHKRSGTRYMLDFDDFNSQHTLDAMKMVIEESCCDAPADVLKWCLDSWDEMYVHWPSQGGVSSARMVGTLPSGHRATSFVNTILNAAYCMYASRDYMSSLDSYHSGDDVIVFGETDHISDYVADIVSSPFRINASKQSIGTACGEFLRVAFTDKEAKGYTARGVSSLVSGNWVTPNLLDKKSYVETLLRGLWTIATRSKCYLVGMLAYTSLCHRVPEVKGIARELITHEISWNGSPVRATVVGAPITIARPSGGETLYARDELPAYHATQDFVDNHVDFAMIEPAGFTPGQITRILQRASVKPRKPIGENPLTYILGESNAYFCITLDQLCTIDAREDKTNHEALNILQRMLTKVDWSKLAGVVRNVRYPSDYTLSGAMPWPIVCGYDLPFSDAMAHRRRLTCSTGILTSYPVRI